MRNTNLRSLPGHPLPTSHRCHRLEYEAFIQLYGQLYYRYARARLDEDAPSRLAVDFTLRAVRRRWADLLRQPCPATGAWRQLRHHVTALRTERDSPVDRLYENCAPDIADIALLSYRLGLPLDATADVMGIDRPIAAAGLRTAMRHCPPQALEHLEEVVPHS